MGIHLFSSSTFDQSGYASQPPNPDPTNYKIMEYWQLGRYLVVQVKYVGCTNFEGVKILVFQDCTLKTLLAQGKIDPHFAANRDYHSPIARFVPTDRGKLLALNFVRELVRMEKHERPTS